MTPMWITVFGVVHCARDEAELRAICRSYKHFLWAWLTGRTAA